MTFVEEYRFTDTHKLAEDLVGHIQKGIINFDIPPQRGYVWDRLRKSEFILNTIQRGPTFPIYINRVGETDYVIDGQQRLKTISSYVANKFSLAKLPPLQTTEEGPIDISGKKFSDLPQEIQSIILRYNFAYNFAEDLSEDAVRTVFIRLNRGKPLSTTEMTKAQIKSVAEVTSMSKHSAFAKIINEKGLEASRSVSLVMQIYIAIFETYKGMLTSSIKKSLEATQISQEQQQRMTNCLNVFEKVYMEISNEKSDIARKLSIIFKRKSHFVAFIYTIDRAIQSGNADSSVLFSWVKYFFNNEKADKTTICDEYNTHLKDAMNSDESVRARLEAMYNDFMQFVSNKNTEK